jgi:hypothetical protein
MSATFEVPVQVDRDLRSASHDAKRNNDSNHKWVMGRVHHPGVRVALDGELLGGSNDAHRSKAKPAKRTWSPLPKVDHHSNINKLNRRHDQTAHTVSYCNAHDEIRDAKGSRSIIDLLPGAGPAAARDDFLYSYDQTDSPAHVLSLEVFVKPDVKGTERFVEKEYEILDANGEAVKGRKARQTLRKSASAEKKMVEVVDEDGFELI